MTPLDPALLAAILDNPDDDFARLVAADWWEEHGEPERAEFVRVQVELNRLLNAPGEIAFLQARLEGLRRRERKLLALDPIFWAATCPCCGSTDNGTTWQRGFIHAIRCSAEHWLEHATAILAMQPVRKVTLTTWPSMDWMFRNVHHLPELAAPLGMPIRKWLLRHFWPHVRFLLPPVPSGSFLAAAQNVWLD